MRVKVSKHLSVHVSQSVSFLYIVVLCQSDLLSWADFNIILIMTACLICSIVLKSTAVKLYILISANFQHISQASSTKSFLYDLYSVIYCAVKSKILLLSLLHSMSRDSLHRQKNCRELTWWSINQSWWVDHYRIRIIIAINIKLLMQLLIFLRLLLLIHCQLLKLLNLINYRC